MQVDKKKVKGKELHYSTPIVLHSTSKSQQELIPFYYPRSSGETELSIKLITYKKADPPESWNNIEEKAITLNAEATKVLFESLHTCYEIKNSEEEGNYLVIRENGINTYLSDKDTISMSSALSKMITNNEVVEHLINNDLSSEIISMFRSAIKVNDLKNALAELRNLLDSGVIKESKYQFWCENHSWIFGSSYMINDEVRSISETDNVDLILPSTITGYRDLIELKKPDMKVLFYDESHKNYYFSSEVSKAIGQCHRYLDVFSERAKYGLIDNPEVISYHPNATIVIGRSSDWDPKMRKALHGLNSRLSSISIITYDQLILHGQKIIDLLEGVSE